MHCLVRQRSIFLDVHNNCWWANLRLYYCHVWLTSFSHYDFSTVKNSLNSETVQQAFTIIYNSKISFTLFTDRIYEIHVSVCVCVSISLCMCVCVSLPVKKLISTIHLLTSYTVSMHKPQERIDLDLSAGSTYM